jgi:3-dehydroquinate dehydratase/shikimate dehydrogenase
VDVELRSGLVGVMLEKAGRGLVISYHDLEGTPADLLGLYQQACEQGADIVKLAVTPGSIADVGRLLDCARRAAQGGGAPLLALAMGPLGIATRILAGRYGAPFTFAAAAAGQEAAAGQLPAAEMAGVYRVRDLSPATRVYGVLGSQVAASPSPRLFNAAFAARGIDAVHVPLQAEALLPFIESIPALELSGFSVARPYKTAILPHLQEAEETAALCGSADTVLVHDGQLRGSTTDGLGITVSLRGRCELKGREVVILGGGGAARAGAMALVRKGARVTVAARDLGQAELIVASVGGQAADLSSIGSLHWDVLINATPVGSKAQVDETLVPTEKHGAESIVLDMVYDPPLTRLLREAIEAGCAVVRGTEMLVAAAAARFEAWTGVEAPMPAMDEAMASWLEEVGA